MALSRSRHRRRALRRTGWGTWIARHPQTLKSKALSASLGLATAETFAGCAGSVGNERLIGPLEMGAARMEAFSDSVMAVIITIMAFELRAPHGATISAVRAQLPGLLVYLLSFAFVGIYWNNHHHLLRVAARISGAVMWANLFVLFWLSLIPVLTEWLRDEYRHSLPAATYGVVALAAGLAYILLGQTLIRANGPDSAVARAIASDVKGYASLGMYAAGVGLAFVSAWISYALYVGVAVIWLIPDRRFTRG